MTISEHIDLFRNMIGEYNDNAFKYTDELLYRYLVDARAVLLYRKSRKRIPLNKYNYSKFCMPLQAANYYDCSCVPDSDCQVMKAMDSLPEVIMGRHGPLLKVTTASGRNIPYLSHTEIADLPYTTTLKNKLVRTNWEDMITLFNHEGLSVIVVEAIIKDPAALTDISVCNLDGTATTDPCFDPQTSEFPIDAELVPAMRLMALQQLIPSLNFQDNAKQIQSADSEASVS